MKQLVYSHTAGFLCCPRRKQRAMKAEGNGEDVQWVVDGRAGVSFNDEGLVISPVFLR